MSWLIFFHLLGAAFAVGFIFFQILLGGRVKRVKGTPDEAALMRAHMAIGRMGVVFLAILLLTGLWMWGVNDYGAMGSVGWLHGKLTAVLVMIGLLLFVTIPNARKVGMGLGTPGADRPVTEEIRGAYRKAVMAGHTLMLLVLLNVFLGYWKPGY